MTLPQKSMLKLSPPDSTLFKIRTNRRYSNPKKCSYFFFVDSVFDISVYGSYLYLVYTTTKDSGYTKYLFFIASNTRRVPLSACPTVKIEDTRRVKKHHLKNTINFTQQDRLFQSGIDYQTFCRSICRSASFQSQFSSCLTGYLLNIHHCRTSRQWHTFFE